MARTRERASRHMAGWSSVVSAIGVSLATTWGTPGAVVAQDFANPQARYLPPGSNPTQPWKLGVRVQNSDRGVQLVEVLPGGAAAKAGLEAGDQIITVGGQQVGYVDGRLVDLGDAVARFVTPNRQITLLIQNRRTGQLNNVVVTLAASNAGVLSGNAIYGRGVPLANSQAVLTLRLRDRTYAGWSGVMLAETNLGRPDRNPIPFQLSYNPAQAFPDHRYVLEAEIVDRGRVTHRGEVQVVYDQGNTPVTVELFAAAVPLPGTPLPGTPLPLGTPPSTFPPPGLPPGGGFGTGSPLDQLVEWYQQYLGRTPTTQEQGTWLNHLARGRSLDEVKSYLLSSSEYYDRNQNNTDAYLRGLYRSLYGSDPTPAQLQTWRQQLEAVNGVRSRFVQQLMSGGEG